MPTQRNPPAQRNLRSISARHFHAVGYTKKRDSVENHRRRPQPSPTPTAIADTHSTPRPTARREALDRSDVQTAAMTGLRDRLTSGLEVGAQLLGQGEHQILRGGAHLLDIAVAQALQVIEDVAHQNLRH